MQGVKRRQRLEAKKASEKSWLGFFPTRTFQSGREYDPCDSAQESHFSDSF
jgi:hypothetical protein